jgi:carboxypeptidase PM20D1
MARRTTKNALVALGVTLTSFISVISARTALYGAATEGRAPRTSVAVSGTAAERLAGAVRIATIAKATAAAPEGARFPALHAHLEASFPRVHARLRREFVNRHSLLYTWPGTDSSLKPVLLMGHLDVVPVEPGTARQWQYGPFSGAIADGFVWGRGAIDNKSAVVGTLEAVEMLLASGFQPTRTIYLAYGHDEESGGADGAHAIAVLLQGRGVELEMVLDEGGVITEGVLAGIATAVALIGVAEKGFATIELKVGGAGGHSSMPPPQSAIGILSAAITRLEANQMPARLEGTAQQMFETLAPASPLLQRALFANLWLTRPLVERTLAGTASTNAMIRTTTAATVFQAGDKDNVLPTSARASINFRILPGDTVNDVLNHVKRVVNDERVEVSIGGTFRSEPSRISSATSTSFRALEAAIRTVSPETHVAPYLVVVVTDARHFAGLSQNIFRFLPLRLTARDLDRMHGIDERIGIDEYENAIRVYYEILTSMAGNASAPALWVDPEMQHHAAFVMFGNVAMRHPHSRIRHVEQQIDRLSRGDQHRVLPHQIRFRDTVSRQDQEPTRAMDVKWMVHRMIGFHRIDHTNLRPIPNPEPPVDR